jgi:nicotinamide riboside transporter PnuC
VLVVVVVVVMIIMVVLVGTIAPHLFELLAPLSGLFAVLAVMLDRVAQFIFCLVNASFACFAFVIIGADWEGRAHQAHDGEQRDAKNSDGAGHGFSLKLGLTS